MKKWFVVLALFLLPVFASAATSGAYANVTNTPPTISAVTPPGPVDPTSCLSTVIPATVLNVTDLNGVGDINASTVYVNYSKGAVTHQALTCVNTVNYSAANTSVFSCTGASFNYYDAPGSWTVTGDAKDYSAAEASNASTSLTFNIGVLMDIQHAVGSVVNFSSVAKGSLNDSNIDGFKLRNCGNVKLNTSITGADIGDGAGHSIPIPNFAVNTTQAGWLQLTALPQGYNYSLTGGIPISTGVDSTWTINYLLNVPSNQFAAIYNTGTWTWTPSQGA